MVRSLAAAGLGALAFAAASPASGQSPATGIELRDPLEPAIPTTTAPLAEPAATIPSGVPRVRIDAFRFRGNRLVASETLAAALGAYTGRELAGPDLHAAAVAVAETYVRHGFLARVRVHAVAVGDGIADIAVEELRLGRINLFLPESSRVNQALAERFLAGRFEEGAPLPLGDIEHRLALLDTQPGVAAAVAIDPGGAADEVDINIRLRDRPLLSGSVALDNHGLRTVGQQQLVAEAHADNALGVADRFSAYAVKAAGAENLAPSFSLPVGGDGLRVGIGGQGYRYRDRMAGRALGLAGGQTAWSLFAEQPLVQRSALAVSAGIALRRIAYHDDSFFGELRRRRITAFDAVVAGRWRSGTATVSWQVALRHGRADLSGNAGDQAIDAASSRIDGPFTRLRWRVGHESQLAGGTLALALRGQQATRNLDVTQAFYLGGAGRVRAYPTAEAVGDTGWLASVEWRRPVTGALTGRLFLDTGAIRRNARPWANQRNAWNLAGAGAGVTWALPERFRLDLDVARQAGGSPTRQSTGTDLDGRADRWRLWLAFVRDF